MEEYYFNDEILNLNQENAVHLSQFQTKLLEDANNLINGFSLSKEGIFSKYLINHIDCVKKGYEYIKENIPSILDDLEIPIEEMDEMIKRHDYSKWSDEEFSGYAKHFSANNTSEPDQDFDNVIHIHHKNNPHHIEYWNGKEIPKSVLVEILCDMWAFSWQKGDFDELYKYWDNHKGYFKNEMNPKSYDELEKMLGQLKSGFQHYSVINGDDLEKLPLSESSLNIRNIIDVEKLKKIESLIKKSNKICIVRHISPDPDAIGSARALFNSIRKKYLKKDIILANENSSVELSENDLLIILDLGVEDRIATKMLIGNPKRVRIDHHMTGMNADVCIEMPEAGSTCELITLFLDENNYDISKDDGELLFKGIISDTGRLQYSIAPTSLLAINILSGLGIDYKSIYYNMYAKDDISVKGKAYILSNYKRTPNGVAYIYIDPSRAKQAGIDADNVAAQVFELGEIKDVPIWVTLNNRKGNIFCKVRSRTIPINKIVEKYGGGGHDNAAGVVLKNKEDAKKLLKDLDSLIK